MQTMRRKPLLYPILGFALAHLLTGAKPLAAQDSCKLVLDAMVKLIDTPTHVFATMSIGGQPQTGESIYVNGIVYTMFAGKWSAGSTTGKMKEIAEKNRQTNKTTCHYLKDEPLNGEAAALYSVHEVSSQSTSDSKVWISRTKGLPLRSDIELNGGKNTISSRYEYVNVKPPM